MTAMSCTSFPRYLAGRVKGGSEVAKSVALLVGTKKGLFTMRSADRKKWTTEGP